MSELNFCPELVGSMSLGAAGNPTVAMVEAAFKHHGLNWRYVNMEVAPEDLGTAVQGAKARGYRGFNWLMRHKVEENQDPDGPGGGAGRVGGVGETGDPFRGAISTSGLMTQGGREVRRRDGGAAERRSQ